MNTRCCSFHPASIFRRAGTLGVLAFLLLLVGSACTANFEPVEAPAEGALDPSAVASIRDELPLLVKGIGEACNPWDACVAGAFCDRPSGAGCDVAGICQPKPMLCVWWPIGREVCGCDGRTYRSACIANQSGTDVRHDGPCGTVGDPPCRGCPSDECLPTTDCRSPTICSDAEEGECVGRPECCTDEPEPTCACDGKWYLNECHALRAGVSPGADPRLCEEQGSALDRCFGGVPSSCGDQDTYCSACGDGLCVQRPVFCGDTCGEEVCGCDGAKYPSACHAAQAGVAVDPNGECGGGCACPPGTFRDVCECDDRNPTGSCVARPISCIRVPDDPVCGCDGKRYRNKCEAHAAGVPVDPDGSCGCDDPPCKEGTVDILCGEKVECVEMPRECPRDIDPVCGCDGITYPNECIALMNGTGVEHYGACHCGKDSPCKWPEQVCSRCKPGECLERPKSCKDVEIHPVCGCDGKTYDNKCLAAQVGVQVVHEGACACESGQKCEAPKEVCDLCRGDGCVEVPESCEDEYAPVCGCDGKTYDNKCRALQAGISVFEEGECPCEEKEEQ